MLNLSYATAFDPVWHQFLASNNNPVAIWCSHITEVSTTKIQQFRYLVQHYRTVFSCEPLVADANAFDTSSISTAFIWANSFLQIFLHSISFFVNCFLTYVMHGLQWCRESYHSVVENLEERYNTRDHWRLEHAEIYKAILVRKEKIAKQIKDLYEKNTHPEWTTLLNYRNKCVN